ncbi:hypothetical protein [Acidianus ambivalens]|uniref:hypothetical protein n=1 Tax=Acidianus ambivalens TaxID=2283 RepID=UPI001E5DC5E8|nr:hypothetical protein [Acidianus ambivalens]
MKIVILGGGFAGLSALKTHDSIMIDNKDYFVLTHKLIDVVKNWRSWHCKNSIS